MKDGLLKIILVGSTTICSLIPISSLCSDKVNDRQTERTTHTNKYEGNYNSPCEKKEGSGKTEFNIDSTSFTSKIINYKISNNCEGNGDELIEDVSTYELKGAIDGYVDANRINIITKEIRITRLTENGISTITLENGDVINLEINKSIAIPVTKVLYDIIHLDKNGYLFFGYKVIDKLDGSTNAKRPIKFDEESWLKKQ